MTVADLLREDVALCTYLAGCFELALMYGPDPVGDVDIYHASVAAARQLGYTLPEATALGAALAPFVEGLAEQFKALSVRYFGLPAYDPPTVDAHQRS